MLNTAKTVREIAVEMPQATRVFEKFGIDYCCGGLTTLEQACAAANLRVDTILQSLESTAVTKPEQDWKAGELSPLIEHVTNTHPAYVKSEVPRIEALAAKGVAVQGKNHPEL